MTGFKTPSENNVQFLLFQRNHFGRFGHVDD